MIVSKDLGGFVLAAPRRKRNFKAVQRAVPDSSIVSETPRQVPMFCISKHIAKPFIYNAEFTPKGNTVPLKSMQEGSHAAGSSIFNAPVFLIPEPLRQPIPVANDFYARMHSLMDDMPTNLPFDVAFDYQAGIRPTIRRLKEQKVEEPDYPFPTRDGKARPPTQQFGTYRLGTRDYEILGY